MIDIDAGCKITFIPFLVHTVSLIGTPAASAILKRSDSVSSSTGLSDEQRNESEFSVVSFVKIGSSFSNRIIADVKTRCRSRHAHGRKERLLLLSCLPASASLLA